MPKAIILLNPRKEDAKILVPEIIRELGKRNFSADTYVFGKNKKIKTSSKYDIAISLGGDGTVLGSCRLMAPLNVPVFTINLGTVGFLAAVHPEEWLKVFDLWLKNEACISKRVMLEARIMRANKEVEKLYCLNEMVISAFGIAKIINLHVFSCSNEEAMSLGQYRSDGLILATPTGSTAHSVAAGGPILDPEMEAFILNPICPFTLSYRPTVHAATEILMVDVEEKRSPVLLTVDGQITTPLKPGDKIYFSRSQWQTQLIASNRSIFYHALRTKLSWLETPGTVQKDETQKVSHA